MTSSHHASASPSAGLWTGSLTDFRHAFRLLWKSKRITVTTLVTLALCIGATTAIFSSVYSLMLKPLPYQEPERIVELYSSAVKAGLNHMPANVPFYLDYSQNATSYESVGLWTFFFGLVGEKDSVVRTPGVRMTAEIFNILRLQPVLGTFFTKEQNKPGADKVIVLTQSYWQTQYQESPEVIGKEVRIDEEPYKVIGVAPRALEAFDARMKFVVPLSWPAAAENPQGRYGVGIQLFGRLKPGVTAGRADAEAKVIEKRYVDAGPPPLKAFVERSAMTMNVGGVQEQRVRPVRPILLMLQGGVAFVLLIGCVNVANLLLVRSNSRQSELAIRSALGAARATIARQFLMESLLLTSLGTLLGLGVAWGLLRMTNYYLAKMLPQSLPASLDWRVLGFAVALTAVVGVLIGLIPVFHILRMNLAAVIQSNSRGSSSSRGVRALSSVLVVAQVAVALMLLTGAGLLIYSFAEAVKVDTGLEAANVVTARIALTREHRASDEAANSIRERLLQALKEIPGVTSVALSFSTPFQGGLPINAFTLENDTLPPGSPQPGAFRVIVTPGYAKTLGLKLVEGRFYEDADLAPGRRQFVVDQSFARKFFPNRSAIGGRFAFGGRPAKPEEWPVIIGVVKDVPHNGVEEKSGNPFIYQILQPGGRPGGLTMFLRTNRPTSDAVAALRNKVRAIAPASPLFDVGVLQEAVDSSFDSRRAVMLLLAAFAGLAMFLSALGIYGVLAYDVSQRTREIGVRSAIGASRGQTAGLILRQGLWKGGIGVVLGLIGAALLSRSMTTLLFNVRPTDPAVYGVVAVLLIGVALLASYLPARRASRIDPLVALRDE
ncbi:MAG TPA: ABC transporter permease [Vicinamibacterales bacterium]|nr:ABC transporter permease [Vicinamibacterales bacterium]